MVYMHTGQYSLGILKVILHSRPSGIRISVYNELPEIIDVSARGKPLIRKISELAINVKKHLLKVK